MLATSGGGKGGGDGVVDLESGRDLDVRDREVSREFLLATIGVLSGLLAVAWIGMTG